MDLAVAMPTIEADYYSDGFMKIIEDHLTYLRTIQGVQVITITNVQCAKFQGDFFGLLVEMRIEPKFHHAIMRVNNLLSSADFTGNINQIVLPPTQEIDMLKNLYQTGS